MKRLFILGAGSMAESFIKGIVEEGVIDPRDIFVCNRSRRERLLELSEWYGITPAHSMARAADADLVILAVKPYDMMEVLKQLRPYLSDQVLLSFAAGVPIEAMQRATGGHPYIVRTMPNVPVAVGMGAIALSAPSTVPRDKLRRVVEMLAGLGQVVEIEEGLMDAATAFSGSGPGFISYLLEAMEQAAVELGFAPELARKLLVQTVIGTAHVLREWNLSPSELRRRVTSPNGTTHAGVEVMQSQGVYQAIVEAVRRAAVRAEEMGREYTREG
ncbi:pyrroline-5-carboxylate reductase [Alicyclobacillus acidocaldarius]|uniref:Pyrroline-5-carboxylate reductase n=1 Tax=Alicyclobacillus acidocaldarius (strain Tc-4-1) TaxID=1048834 RepID=F8IK60_ALIAT|nr:pyrroline-5-carboxylate reductase [Alicyclobacillus acidocaldarius]AEJ44766.1 pyrroline-5-carboxylate reductase [Alicyclobacillus acidocaldarius subsp. acidocaldarius Tc-4-1]